MGAVTRQLRAVHAYTSDRWYLRALIGAAFVSLLLLLVIAWIDATGSRTDQRVALTFLINLTAVIGIQIFMGNSGVPSFGHVAFVGVGAYTAAILMTPTERKMAPSLIPDAPSFILNAELTLLPALAAAVLVVAVVAMISGAPIMRLRGGSAAIATLALLVIVRTVIGNWGDITRGPQTWSGIPEYTTMWIALGFAIGAIFVARFFRESGVGLRLRATRSDELASSAVGVNLWRARYAAWIVSAMVAGAAGVIYAAYFLSLAPQNFFFDLTFIYIVMVILGGPTVSGAVVGAATVTLIQEVVRRGETQGIAVGPIEIEQAFGLTPIVLGLLVLLTVILRSEGMLGRWELDEWVGKAFRRLRGRPKDAAIAEAAATDGRAEQPLPVETELRTGGSGREPEEVSRGRGAGASETPDRRRE